MPGAFFADNYTAPVCEQIVGKTRKEIQEMLALSEEPTHFNTVLVRAGTEITEGTVGPQSFARARELGNNFSP